MRGSNTLQDGHTTAATVRPELGRSPPWADLKAEPTVTQVRWDFPPAEGSPPPPMPPSGSLGSPVLTGRGAPGSGLPAPSAGHGLGNGSQERGPSSVLSMGFSRPAGSSGLLGLVVAAAFLADRVSSARLLYLFFIFVLFSHSFIHRDLPAVNSSWRGRRARVVWSRAEGALGIRTRAEKPGTTGVTI